MSKSNISEHLQALPIKCACCGKDLSDNPASGLIKVISRINDDGVKVIEDYIIACKGECDHRIHVEDTLNDGWLDLTDIQNPLIRESYWISILNGLTRGKLIMTQKACESFKEIIINTLPYSSRDITEREAKDAKTYYMAL